MNFYIATSLERAVEHKALREKLEALGHHCTYDWAVHGSVQDLGPERIVEVAEAEIIGVDEADVVIVLLPGGRGTHAELGAAINSVFVGCIIVVGEMKDPDGRECAFYYHPDVSRVKDVEELLEHIKLRHSYELRSAPPAHLPGCDCISCFTDKGV